MTSRSAERGAPLWELEYELAQTWRQLEAADASSSEGDSGDSPEAVATLQNYLEARGEAIAKRDRVAGFIMAVERWAEHLDDQVKMLTEKRARARRIAERVKHYVLDVMNYHGHREIQGETWTLTKRLNPPRVVIAPGTRLPERFMRTRTTQEPDLEALREALSSGVELEGVSLVRGERLVIS